MIVADKDDVGRDLITRNYNIYVVNSWHSFCNIRIFEYSYIVDVSFISGGNQSTGESHSKSQTNFITYCCIKYTSL